MTTREIENGNKLIAEFLGGSVLSSGICLGYSKMNIPQWAFKLYDFDTMKIGGYEYHSSWDWLHPVINKLCDIGDSRQFNDAFYEKKLSILNAPLYCGIKDAWEMTVEAITWYNQQGTKINR